MYTCTHKCPSELHTTHSNYLCRMQLGPVEDAVVMMDHQSRRSRGFGFVSFADEGTAELVLRVNPRPILFGRQVEIKRAVPREQLQQDPYALQRRFNSTMLPAGHAMAGMAGGYAASSPFPMGYGGAAPAEGTAVQGVYMPPERQARPQMPTSVFGYSAEWSQLLERHGQRASTAPQMLADLQGWQAAQAAAPPMHMASVDALSAPMFASRGATAGNSSSHAVDAAHPGHAGHSATTHSGTITTASSVLQPGLQPYSGAAGVPATSYYSQMANQAPDAAQGGSNAPAGQADAFDSLAASLSAALPTQGHDASSQSGQWN